jgi:hypothetical protein
MTIHEWLPWIPTTSLGLAARNIPVMTFLVLFEAVVIASEPYLPKFIECVFPQRRVEAIKRIYSTLCELQDAPGTSHSRQAELDNAVNASTVAMVYVWRAQSGTNYAQRSMSHGVGNWAMRSPRSL